MFCIIILLGCCSCTSINVKDDLQPFERKGHGNLIVLLSDFKTKDLYDDQDAEACIGKSLKNESNKFDIFPAKQFRDAMFPFFLASTTPNTKEEYQNFLSRPVVQKKMSLLDISYLVILKILTNNEFDGIAGCGYGGCLGYGWWKRNSNVNADIWDVTSKIARNISAQASGTGQMPVFLIPIPVYIPATESAACREIGARLAKYLK
jgi:hypothetical protein